MIDETTAADPLGAVSAVDGFDEVAAALLVGEQVRDGGPSWICHPAHPAESLEALSR